MNHAAARLRDCALALVLLLVTVPVQLVTAVLVWVTLGRPILFRHRRAGLHGEPFVLYKFRTMREGPPGKSDAARLTRLGRWLRAFSLDELPQLWNVLRGDMSLVGPRPLLPRYLDRYSKEQMRRHEIRPGITGLAQVSGRNGISWDERFALDVWYVDHRNGWLDAWILWRTLVTVLRRDRISADGHATMPEFEGSAHVLPAITPCERRENLAS